MFAMSALGIVLLASPRLWELAHRGRKWVHVMPGELHIGGMDIRARDIVGASTGRAEDGVLVTVKQDRDEPISLVVRNDADAHAILGALGVGHTGAGRLEWIVLKRSFTMFLAVFEWLLGILWAITLVEAVARNDAAIGFSALSVLVMAITALMRMQWKANAQSVAFDPWGVWVRGHQIPWSSLESAIDHPLGIELMQRGGGIVVAEIPNDSMRSAEKEIVLAQIRAGIGRSRGLGPSKVEPSTRVDILARGDDPTRQWLTRVDTLANGIGKAGYRETSVEFADLWLTVEDPEAPADLRAAAARVLSRSEPSARVRIDAVIAALRDPREGKRMRIVIERDVEEAAIEIEQLERTKA